MKFSSDVICDFNVNEYTKVFKNLYKIKRPMGMQYFILKNVDDNEKKDRYFYRITNHFFIEK